MVSINIRELTHHFSRYIKKVKKGERITLLERNIPIADITPHNQNITSPGWKRSIKKIQLKGEAISETVSKLRREETR